ncbi:nucleotidyl transferase AbiEii/AbiGii toxin family protein [Empedobacter falsenii]|uniref:Nucleotidyl transferase AbiEii/AbiGii toxin family protein n=1 Tax=Empedobacter falsenii TaxID=343874 RepID=A0A427BG06_9FLAO|nr:MULTISPECIES: nucleotidyl transferase AbiEii/AbiGii toxin family protein [Empedobacter]MDM1063922.1 nucleotidyl transferase AbiEii/AbiGii toxin family protein [Empedobacter falsenii]MDM1139843.1 nucleotidyl transferase AbiEii/AbiGii toxin family protein [Empedobacter sp. R132-2]RRT86497.1 nucleotidyl transferase AbiEii/AbiGii toxin family protein [Empedobacter falsenii]RRT87859.1 nucleotidyl transferase AbiEii/AbiGii toxin family protein [Empedobacter falsenii]
MSALFYNTVNPILKSSLETLMVSDIFKGFRLVGGTSLSLQLGHRISIDIDLFSDIEYGSIDFDTIENFLLSKFNYLDFNSDLIPAFGKSYTIGDNKDNSVKLDIFYTDPFITNEIVIDNIRLASIDEIIAMKIDVIQRGGRKKDFWDLHELLDKYDISEMIKLHEKRYPYSHDPKLIHHNLTNFSIADDDFDPICLRGKYWEFIKDDFEELVKK